MGFYFGASTFFSRFRISINGREMSKIMHVAFWWFFLWKPILRYPGIRGTLVRIFAVKNTCTFKIPMFGKLSAGFGVWSLRSSKIALFTLRPPPHSKALGKNWKKNTFLGKQLLKFMWETPVWSYSPNPIPRLLFARGDGKYAVCTYNRFTHKQKTI